KTGKALVAEKREWEGWRHSPSWKAECRTMQFHCIPPAVTVKAKPSKGFGGLIGKGTKFTRAGKSRSSRSRASAPEGFSIRKTCSQRLKPCPSRSIGRRNQACRHGEAGQLPPGNSLNPK